MTSEQRTAYVLGTWFLAKWRNRLADSGDVQFTARQMRKAGVPIELALTVLARRWSVPQ